MLGREAGCEFYEHSNLLRSCETPSDLPRAGLPPCHPSRASSAFRAGSRVLGVRVRRRAASCAVQACACLAGPLRSGAGACGACLFCLSASFARSSRPCLSPSESHAVAARSCAAVLACAVSCWVASMLRASRCAGVPHLLPSRFACPAFQVSMLRSVARCGHSVNALESPPL